MERIKIDILGIAELQWTQKSIFQKDGHAVIYSGGDTNERGVGLIPNSITANIMKGYWAGVGSSSAG